MSTETEDEFDARLNMDDIQTRQRFIRYAGSRKGWWKIAMKRTRPQRSQNQNAWYFAEIVQSLVDWMWRENREVITKDDAHDYLASRFLGVDVKVAGAFSIPCRKPTHTLGTAEFSDYCEKCRAFLLDYCNVVTS